MGCCFSDPLLSSIAPENQLLLEENLTLLKSLAVYFTSKDCPGMVVKLLNIRNITKGYYSKVSSDRSYVVSQSSRLDQKDYEEAEKTLKREQESLKETNKVLKEKFYELIRPALFFGDSPARYVAEFMKDNLKKYEYKELLSMSKRYAQNGQGVEVIARRLNHGEELSDQMNKILIDVSKVTSHIANNSRRGICYFSNLSPEISPQRVRTVNRETHAQRIQKQTTCVLSRIEMDSSTNHSSVLK